MITSFELFSHHHAEYLRIDRFYSRKLITRSIVPAPGGVKVKSKGLPRRDLHSERTDATPADLSKQRADKWRRPYLSNYGRGHTSNN
jgi:hypothetical protein